MFSVLNKKKKRKAWSGGGWGEGSLGGLRSPGPYSSGPSVVPGPLCRRTGKEVPLAKRELAVCSDQMVREDSRGPGTLPREW